MDPQRFDRLTEALSVTLARRGLLRGLAALLPLAGGLAALPGGEAAPGRDRRRNRRRDRRRTRKRKKRKAPCAGLRPTDDLHAAVAAAAPGESLTLCAGTWALTDTVVIAQDLALRGAGAGKTVLDGADAVRVLLVEDPGTTATLRDLTVANGVHGGGGGGIFNEGTLTLRGVTVTGSSAAIGAGIDNWQGVLTLEAGSRVTGNEATVRGGGIHNAGTLTLEAGSRVTGNEAAEAGGGIYSASGTVSVAPRAVVAGNTPDDCQSNTGSCT